MLASLVVAALTVAFLTMVGVLMGGPGRAGALYPKFLMGVRMDRKFALGLAITSASCLLAGASFACIALLRKMFPGQPFYGYAHILMLFGVSVLATGPLMCELIWLWMLGPIDGRLPFKTFFRWTDHNRYGALLLLRWAGAFALFIITYRATKGLDIAGATLVLYSVMLGFIDAAVLGSLRPRPLVAPDDLA